MLSAFRSISSRFLIAVFLSAVGVTATADESESSRILRTHWPAAQQRFSAGEFDEALQHYQKVVGAVPHEPSSRFEIARCLAMPNKPKKALESLALAVEFGWEDVDRLNTASEFEELRNTAEFTRITEAARACQNEEVLLYSGENIDPTKPVTVIVLLQGLGAGPRAEIPYWKQVADDLNCVVVSPRATNRFAPMLFGWQREEVRDSTSRDYFDIVAAKKRINTAIGHVKSNLEVEPSQIILAGFSQGGGVALRCYGDQPERYQGVIAVCSLCQKNGSDYWTKAAQRTGERVVVIAGEFDPLYLRSRDLIKELEEAGVAHRFLKIADHGHEYPTNYNGVLRDALQGLIRQRQEAR